NPAVDRDLETICLKCLQKEPGQRYVTAAALAEDLSRFLAGGPIRARALKVVQRAGGRLWERRRSVAGLLWGSALATPAIAGTFVGWRSYTRWRSGLIFFETTGPPLLAEILDEAGETSLVRTTVPMAEPLSLPAGEYQVMLSAAGFAPQRYRFTAE